MKSNSILKLAAALVKAQSELTSAPQSSTNPHFDSHYANLAALWKTARPILAKHSLAVLQLVGHTDAKRVVLTTMLVHESGEWIGDTASIPIAKDDPHGFGSGLTYLRRYAFGSILGMISEPDDDGNKGTGSKKGSANDVNREAYEAMSEADQTHLRAEAEAITDYYNNPSKGIAPGAYYLEQEYDDEQKLALWFLLEAPVRRVIKRYKAPDASPTV